MNRASRKPHHSGSIITKLVAAHYYGTTYSPGKCLDLKLLDNVTIGVIGSYLAVAKQKTLTPRVSGLSQLTPKLYEQAPYAGYLTAATQIHESSAQVVQQETMLKEVDCSEHLFEKRYQIIEVFMLKCNENRLRQVNLPIVTIGENVFITIVNTVTAGRIAPLH